MSPPTLVVGFTLDDLFVGYFIVFSGFSVFVEGGGEEICGVCRGDE